MFSAEIYKSRRQALLKNMRAAGAKGIAVFLGNADAAMNYKSNCYPFLQDNNFLYFWGLQEPGFAASINLENGRECIYGDDVDIDDIIWMGPQAPVAEKAASVGVEHVAAASDFGKAVQYALQNDVPVHFLPSDRRYNRMVMAEYTGSSPDAVYDTAPYDEKDYVHSSLELTEAVISLRLVKEDCEIAEIDKACDLGVRMHDVGRNGCRIGARERDIAGAMDGFAGTEGWGVSFPTILSQNGQILHGHDHSLVITDGRLLLIDAGIVLDNGYCSDFTRTLPCGGKFTTRQREIYDIVEGCNELAYRMSAPGVAYRDVHIAVTARMLEGLKALGLVEGDVDEMNAEGIAGMFMPHGLGHNMGLDVHDMESLGEDLVGYDKDQSRSDRLGLASLRMARRLVPGNVVTDEPGIYFIPALWDWFRRKGLDKGFIRFDRLEAYAGFGGIRLEDDLLITGEGCRHLGSTRLPIKADEVEKAMN